MHFRFHELSPRLISPRVKYGNGPSRGVPERFHAIKIKARILWTIVARTQRICSTHELLVEEVRVSPFVAKKLPKAREMLLAGVLTF